MKTIFDNLNSSNFFQYPSNELELNILKIWQKILNKQLIGKEDSFFKLGGNPQLALELATELGKMVKKNIPLSLPFIANTIRSQANYLNPKRKRHSFLPLTLLSDSQNKKNTHIFLIHPAGGLSFFYFPLAKEMKDFTLYGINNPYLGEAQKFETIEQMASLYIKFVKEIQDKGPYIFGGWSFGGNVALEMAKQIIEMQDTIKSVILLDSFNYSQISNQNIKKREIAKVIAKKNSALSEKELLILSSEFENNEKLGELYRPNRMDIPAMLIKTSEKEECFSSFQNLSDNGWSPLIQNLTIDLINCNHSSMMDTVNTPVIASIIKDKIINMEGNLCH